MSHAGSRPATIRHDAVERILASHPAVAAGGDLNFWDNEGPAIQPALRPAEGADLTASAAACLARREKISPHHARVANKNPFNYRWAAPAHLVFPNATVIHCRRRPGDTALSTMLAALRPQPLFGMARGDLLFTYREHARATDHLRRTLTANRYYELHYDKLVTDPEAEIRALLEFCGLEWEQACLDFQHNPSPTTTASATQVRQSLYDSSIAQWRHYAPQLEGLRRQLVAAGIEVNS